VELGAVITEPILEAADFFAPPGYRVHSCAVFSRTRELEVMLLGESGKLLELTVDISGFADEPKCWRWLKDVIDLEALWALG
jgi:hypothetical protein